MMMVSYSSGHIRKARHLAVPALTAAVRPYGSVFQERKPAASPHAAGRQTPRVRLQWVQRPTLV